MSGMAVMFDDAYRGDVLLSTAWQVVHVPSRRVLLHGFGRKRDAEIAMEFLSHLGIDWTQDRETLLTFYREVGGHDDLMKKVCEHLQW